jgi:hypothetical protein
MVCDEAVVAVSEILGGVAIGVAPVWRLPQVDIKLSKNEGHP